MIGEIVVAIMLVWGTAAVTWRVAFSRGFRQGDQVGFARALTHAEAAVPPDAPDGVLLGGVPLEFISGISGISERFLREVLDDGPRGLKVCTCGAALTGLDHEPGCPSWHDDDGMPTGKEWRP